MRPGIKLFRRNRILARDLLGAYLAGRDSPEDSHLSTGRPPHISICVWKTIRPLRIVGHVFPLASVIGCDTHVSSIETSKPAKNIPCSASSPTGRTDPIGHSGDPPPIAAGSLAWLGHVLANSRSRMPFVPPTAVFSLRKRRRAAHTIPIRERRADERRAYPAHSVSGSGSTRSVVKSCSVFGTGPVTSEITLSPSSS